MFSTVLGWILIGLGIASYVMALVILVKTLLTRPVAKKPTPSATQTSSQSATCWTK